MELAERLQQLLELDELKSETATTKAIQEVLKVFLSLDGSKKLKLQQLVEKIRRSYEKMLVAVKRRRSVTSKLDKLYCLFHEFTISEGFEMCSSCEKDLEMIVPEILWQLLMEKEFIWFLTNELVSNDAKDQPATDRSAVRTLSEIEENAVRYTAGYVIRKLEQNYSKKKEKSKAAAECTLVLQEMGRKMPRHPATEEIEQREQQSSNKWTSLVNRGGLYFIQDEVFDLFVTIELLVDCKLSQIFNESGKGIEQVKKENLFWVCQDDDVQCVWSHISPNTIEEETVREDLLREIIYMWVTTRGYSKAHRIKENYKLQQKKGLKGTRSLRKELDSQ